MTEEYDVIVVGGGPGGEIAAEVRDSADRWTSRHPDLGQPKRDRGSAGAPSVARGGGGAVGVETATIAVVGQVPLEELQHAVPSFPSLSEVWLKALENYEMQEDR